MPASYPASQSKLNKQKKSFRRLEMIRESPLFLAFSGVFVPERAFSFCIKISRNIDPPYNTRHYFVYKDKFGDTIENYKEQAGLAGQYNAETSGRYHSDWCSMMYPRLRFARELLSETEIFMVSIGNQELSNLTSLCDEIFW